MIFMMRRRLSRVKKIVARIKGKRLRDIGQTRLSRRGYIIRQMTPSEVEYAEKRYGKPIEKFTTEELEKEFDEIKKTYPELEW